MVCGFLLILIADSSARFLASSSFYVFPFSETVNLINRHQNNGSIQFKRLAAIKNKRARQHDR